MSISERTRTDIKKLYNDGISVEKIAWLFEIPEQMIRIICCE